MLKPISSFLKRTFVRPKSQDILPRPPKCTHIFCTPFSYCAKDRGIELQGPIAEFSDTLLPASFQSTNQQRYYFAAAHDAMSTYSWNSNFGWGERCDICHISRCTICSQEEERMETSIKDINDVLNLESMEVRVCTPCVHECCPGWVIKMVVLCRECGHVACGTCVYGSGDGKGRCCKGCRPTSYISSVVEELAREKSRIEMEIRKAVETELDGNAPIMIAGIRTKR